MTGIREFILARLDEREHAAAAANAGSPAPWTYGDVDSVAGGSLYDRDQMIAGMHWDNDPVPSTIRRTRPPAVADAVGEHIVLHDPDRALREVAALRDVLDCVKCLDAELVKADHSLTSYTYGVLESLADIWRDHPDYESWVVVQ